MATRTLYEKLWHTHEVVRLDDEFSVLYVDRHLIHEGSAAYALDSLHAKGLALRRPSQTIGVADHVIPTEAAARRRLAGDAARFVATVADAGRRYGYRFFGPSSAWQGISHVVGPELGVTLPGITIACGDSHTSTHGALGALPLAIGISEVEQVLATQALIHRRARTMRVRVEGGLAPGVSAKDLALALLRAIGVAGAAGHAVEFAGCGVPSLSLEGRMTVCNMAIEAGARTAIIAPDDAVFTYLQHRPFAPRGASWERALEGWRSLRTDDAACFDRAVDLAAGAVEPQVTWGTQPDQAASVAGRVPDPDATADDTARAAMSRALAYMDLKPGTALQDIAVDRIFIGSCTNGRIEDLRAAAEVVAGRRVAPSVHAMLVPGSMSVKQQAESEGLLRTFEAAGFDVRDAGCSMCLAMNGDMLRPGERCAATSNRNFQDRQGPRGRTHLMSPATAAASAIMGHIADPRPFLAG